MNGSFALDLELKSSDRLPHSEFLQPDRATTFLWIPWCGSLPAEQDTALKPPLVGSSRFKNLCSVSTYLATSRWPIPTESLGQLTRNKAIANWQSVHEIWLHSTYLWRLQLFYFAATLVESISQNFFLYTDFCTTRPKGLILDELKTGVTMALLISSSYSSSCEHWERTGNFFFVRARCLSAGLRSSLTRGPAGNRTATGSVSTTRVMPYQLHHEDDFGKNW